MARSPSSVLTMPRTVPSSFLAVDRQLPHFRGLSFSTISSTGANASVIHYSPPSDGTSAVIDPSKIYLCDSGAQFTDGTTECVPPPPSSSLSAFTPSPRADELPRSHAASPEPSTLASRRRSRSGRTRASCRATSRSTPLSSPTRRPATCLTLGRAGHFGRTVSVRPFSFLVRPPPGPRATTDSRHADRRLPPRDRSRRRALPQRA